MKTSLSQATACFTKRLWPLIIVIACLGCGGASMHPIQPVHTKYITLQADPMINNGKDLAVDIIYVTYVQELRELSQVGPKAWFAGEKRGSWKFKESVIVKGGDNMTVKLDPLVLRRTVLLVVYADYEGMRDPGKMQVIVDYAGVENEAILIKKTGLKAQNESLRYIE